MTDLTRTKKLHLIDDLIAAHDAVSAQLDALRVSINPDPGCPLYNAIFELLNVAIASTSAAVGDKSEWIDWFIHENDCGRKGYEAGYEGQIKPIMTAEDLLDLIEQGEE